jgi:hypothetical protein
MDWLGWVLFLLSLLLGGCGREATHPDAPVGRFDPAGRRSRRGL